MNLSALFPSAWEMNLSAIFPSEWEMNFSTLLLSEWEMNLSALTWGDWYEYMAGLDMKQPRTIMTDIQLSSQRGSAELTYQGPVIYTLAKRHIRVPH